MRQQDLGEVGTGLELLHGVDDHNVPLGLGEVVDSQSAVLLQQRALHTSRNLKALSVLALDLDHQRVLSHPGAALCLSPCLLLRLPRTSCTLTRSRMATGFEGNRSGLTRSR